MFPRVPKGTYKANRAQSFQLVTSAGVPFTAITRVQIPSGTPAKQELEKPGEIGSYSSAFSPSGSMICRATRLCALRFTSVTACVYTSIVTLKWHSEEVPGSSSRLCITRNELLRCLRFATFNPLIDHIADDTDFQPLEIDVGPLEAQQLTIRTVATY